MPRAEDGNNHEESIKLSVSAVPRDETIFFQHSSFFTKTQDKTALPLPAEVREQARLHRKERRGRILPAHFPSLNLIVKYGCDTTIAEGQCLWAIKRLLGDRVPVPEVYGWCKNGEETFIYMERVRGDTLEERWDSLTSKERVAVSDQLRGIVQSLGRLRQDADDPYVGSIGRGPLRDVMFDYLPQAGPFRSVKELNDWWAHQVNRHHPDLENYVDPVRSSLDDDAPIRFTHSDLHPSNIMISSDVGGQPRVSAIIDWHQSGWYPAYWEYGKTLYTVLPDTDWAGDYVPRFLHCPDSHEAWFYYMDSLGC